MMFHKDYQGYDSGDWQAGHGWGRQARRGDMRLIVLHVLNDRPMHGYEIIRHLEDKSHGLWRPSPGSIYPTLQLLEEEGLVKGRDDDGKRIYELTDEGRNQAKTGPSEHWQKFEQAGAVRELHQVGFGLMHQLKHIMRSRSEADIQAAVKILQHASGELSAMMDNKEGKTD